MHMLRVLLKCLVALYEDAACVAEVCGCCL